MISKLKTIGVLATTLLATLGAASAAQAAAGFTNPTEPNGYVYTNNATPIFSFAGAPAHTTVRFQSGAGTVFGSATTDGSGNVTFPPSSSLSPGFHNLYLYTYDGTYWNWTPYDVGVFVDQTPLIQVNSGFPGINVVDAPASFFIYSAIPSKNVKLNITQLGGSASAIAQAPADNNGYIYSMAPSSPLAPGEYQATAATIDAQGIASDPSSPQTFYVAPAQPAITAIDGQPVSENATVNDGNPDLSLSGVRAGADVKLFTLDENGNPVQVGEQTAATGGSLVVRASGLADGPVSLYATQTIDENGTPVSSDGSTDQYTPYAVAAAKLAINVNTAPGSGGNGGDPTPPANPTPQANPTAPVNPTPPANLKPPVTPTRPLVSSGTLTASHPVTVTVTAPKSGKVTLTLTGKVHGKTKVIGTVTVKASKAGQVGYKLTTRFAGHKLAKGAYTLTAKAPGAKPRSARVNVR